MGLFLLSGPVSQHLIDPGHNVIGTRGQSRFPAPCSVAEAESPRRPPRTLSSPLAAPSAVHFLFPSENGYSRPPGRPHTRRRRASRHWLKEWEKGQLVIRSCFGRPFLPAFLPLPAYGSTERVDDWYLPPCFKRSCSISFGGGPPALSARRRKWSIGRGLNSMSAARLPPKSATTKIRCFVPAFGSLPNTGRP